MKEIDEFQKGLMSGNLMLCNLTENTLECTFYQEGKVISIVLLTDCELAASVYTACSLGILEGVAYHAFKHNFQSFALHIKALKLYRELIGSIAIPKDCFKQKMAA